MEISEILNDLHSFHWWVSVVLVGVAASIIGNFCFRFIDVILKSTFDWWDKRQKATDSRFQKELEELVKAPQHEKIVRIAENRARLKATENIVMSILWVLMNFVAAIFGAPKWLGAILLAGFILSWISYVYYSRIARRLERLLNQFYLTVGFVEDSERRIPPMKSIPKKEIENK